MEETRVVHLPVIDRLYLSLIEPLDTLAILPKAVLNFVVLWNDVGAQTVLLALVPIALVAALVSPCVDTESVLLVVFVLASVHTSIIPDVDAHTLHVVIEPLALILATIKPGVDANARDFILSPVTSVHRAIIPLVAADAVLASKGVVALVA